MSNQDDRLQDLLDNRIPAASPPVDQGEEGELIRLASLAETLRRMEHPHLSKAVTQAQRTQFLNAGADLRKTDSPQIGIWAKGWSFIMAGGMPLAVLLLICLATLSAGAVWFGLSRQAGTVALAEVNGLVEFSTDEGDWQVLEEEQRLRAGQAIRTGPASSVRLDFYEGSTTWLEPNTALELVEVTGGLGTLRVALNQTAGGTTHQVVPLRSARSSFLVASPAGEARVKGTTFQIAVDAQGNTRYSVVSGKVAVLAAGQEVQLDSGQATTVRLGESPESPAYQFRGRGLLSNISGTTWTIGGVPVTVIDQTDIVGDPQVGGYARVVGRLLDGGIWLADRIEEMVPVESRFQFAGFLEAIENGLWTVGEVEVVVDERTDVEPDLDTGDLVMVTFTVLGDGTWLALKVAGLEETPEEPTPTPTATPDPAAQPSLSFEPDELVARGCTQQFEFTGTLVNTGSPPDDYAANVVLGFTILRGAEYVQAVEIDPLAWEQIPAGEGVNFAIRVGLNPSWLDAAEGSEVKLRLFIANETNRPGHHHTRLTMTMVAQCDDRPSPTPSPTATATITSTMTLTPTATMTPTPQPQPEEGAKVTICHRPPGNPENAHTITIGRSALPAHLAHGDTLGPCPGRR